MQIAGGSFGGLATLVVVGLLAGAVNAVAGGGSMISFPALLALGVPPVTANVTNSLAALPGYLGGCWGYRRELRGQRGLIVRGAIACSVGGLGGALALLAVSPESFRAVLPWLVLVAVALLAAQPLLLKLTRGAGRPASAKKLMGAGVVAGFYGGFFVAGLGIVLLAVLGLFLAESTQRLNALKGALSLVVGSVAAVVFVLFAPVAWGPAVVLALTGLLGGRLGVGLARRISGPTLRWCVVAWGIAVAIALEVTRHVS